MWRIWFECYADGKSIGKGVWHYRYKYKCNAVRRAKKQFDTRRINKINGKLTTYKWIVSETNPWIRRKENAND